MSLRSGLTLGLALAAAAVVFLLLQPTNPSSQAAAPDPASPVTTVEPEESIAGIRGADVPQVEREEVSESSVLSAESFNTAAQTLNQPVGTLVAFLRTKEAGISIQGEHLFLVPKGATQWTSLHVEGSKGKPGESPQTDANGRAEFELPLGVEYTLDVWARGSEFGPAQLDIAAMNRPETVEVVLQVPTAHDLRFVGRVLAAETRKPLLQAKVSIMDPRSDPSDDEESPSEQRPLVDAQADTEGYFDLLLPSWQEVHAQVTAPGYSTVLLEITSATVAILKPWRYC